jgi:hypothetical protein
MMTNYDQPARLNLMAAFLLRIDEKSASGTASSTGDSFRSSDLGVMSPARCLCATPVKIIRIVPTAGFDPATSPL